VIDKDRGYEGMIKNHDLEILNQLVGKVDEKEAASYASFLLLYLLFSIN